MMRQRYSYVLCFGVMLVLSLSLGVQAQETGVHQVMGRLNYTNPLFARGLTEPVVILEDISAWFLQMPQARFSLASQVTAQVLAQPNAYEYVLDLPLVPQGEGLMLADNPQALQVFAVSFWSNLFGDERLEYRDQRAGGWSRNYASWLFDEQGALVGGAILVYAPEDGLLFPSDWDVLGGSLSTSDWLSLSAGWTMLSLETRPFSTSRSAQVRLDLQERQTSALTDFSSLTYIEAFDSLIELLRKEYAFTEYKGIDWDALVQTFRPRMLQAHTEASSEAFAWALQELVWQIPDGHMSLSFNQAFYSRFQAATSGGIGLVLAELSDGRFVAWHVVIDSPAQAAGIRQGDEILSIDGVPMADLVQQVTPWSAPFSTPHVRRLQALRYVTRFQLGQSLTIAYRDAEGKMQSADLVAVDEQASLRWSSFNQTRDPFTPPIEARLQGRFAHIIVYDFADDARLTVQLWERAIQTAIQNRAQGILIDLRENTGGNLYLADMLAGYVHAGYAQAERLTGAIGFYQSQSLLEQDLFERSADGFEFADSQRRFISSAPDALLWQGKLAVLISPACASACEFFAYNLALDGRAETFGMYPSAGMGGTVKRLRLPDGLTLQFTNGRAVDAEGEIHIEGRGIAPTQPIAVSAESLFATDAILEAALTWLSK